jgi:transposase, IS6 family
VLAVRWYLRFGLSYRDVEELLAERGVEVDHVTVYRWVQRFTPLLAEAARPCRHAVGDRWFVDETYLKVAGRWRYLYRAVDQFGQVVDVFLSSRRDTEAARRFFDRAIGTTKVTPAEVVTDKANVYRRVLDERAPAAWHRIDRYGNNRIEADHGQLKHRLRTMRGLKTDAGASVVTAGHAFVQNLRRGHYELAVDEPGQLRVTVAFNELATAIQKYARQPPIDSACGGQRQCNSALDGERSEVSKRRAASRDHASRVGRQRPSGRCALATSLALHAPAEG